MGSTLHVGPATPPLDEAVAAQAGEDVAIPDASKDGAPHELDDGLGNGSPDETPAQRSVRREGVARCWLI
jgi:hypothetical protein